MIFFFGPVSTPLKFDTMEINVPLTILLKLVYIMKMRIPMAALTLTREKKAHQVSVLSYTII